MDLEATGLPSPGNNPTISELCLIAVHRMSLMDNAKPRVLNKLSLCINPMKPISPAASSLTGKQCLVKCCVYHHKGARYLV